MALATQCPHCHTTFRVAHDQLKLRAGIVRCGTCKQIFNGVEHLLPPEAIQPGDTAQHPDVSASGGKTDPTQPAATSDHVDQPDGDRIFKPFEAIVADTPVEPAPPAAIPPTHISSPAPIDLDLDQAEYEALERMTQQHFLEAEQPWEDIPLKPSAPVLPAEPEALPESTLAEEEAPGATPVGLKYARHDPTFDMHAEPASATAAPAEAEYDFAIDEPDFVKRGRQQQRNKRPRQLLFGIAALLLFIGALAQATYAFRNQIAARLPQSKPALIAACAMAGCKIEWPAQIDLLTIESSELQALPNNSSAFSLTLLLRNHGSTTEAWPNIQLTLNDENERAVARRVFLPREYLGSAAEMEKGFPSNTEQAVKVFFTLAQLKASGYRVYLFYP